MNELAVWASERWMASGKLLASRACCKKRRRLIMRGESLGVDLGKVYSEASRRGRSRASFRISSPNRLLAQANQGRV